MKVNIDNEFFKLQQEIKEKIANRQPANKVILKKLGDLVEKHPDIRFIQLLINVGIIQDEVISNFYGPDPFEEESVDTMNRMNENLKKYKL